MIDYDKRTANKKKRDRVSERYRNRTAPDEIIPEKKQPDFYDDDASRRVAIYVRVSTDNIAQATSYELQKSYYEEFVKRHENWTLVKIYADEGISGTSMRKREALLQMLSDCRAGKIDLIITKSVSRLARNVVDCITMVRELTEMPNPVGVFFESECIFTLNQESAMPLSFLASIAEQESTTRSRSMDVSLSQRLNGGLPLTPKLLGYKHDLDGNLIINQEEAPTVKLMFYMYLYGYSSQEIADKLAELQKKTYRGNIKWSSSTVIEVLKNERHCGDVKTQKTVTYNRREHKSRKNRGEKRQSIYYNHHEAIISRDDFIAVQQLLTNAKYKNKSILPELRVITDGLLKGFVTINPRWSGFKAGDYYQASASVRQNEEDGNEASEHSEFQITVEAGDLDMRGFEVMRGEFLDFTGRPYVTFQDKKAKFSMDCIRRFGKDNMIELLVNPITRKIAVRSASKDNRQAIKWSTVSNGIYYPKVISCAAFFESLYDLFGWNTDYKYRASGSVYVADNETIYIFDVDQAEVFIKQYMLTDKFESDSQEGSYVPLSKLGKRIRAIPEYWMDSFGSQYYIHQNQFPPVDEQSEQDWKLRMEGKLFEVGRKLNVTSFDELKRYIEQELSECELKELSNG